MPRAHRFARSMRRYGRLRTRVPYLGGSNRDGSPDHEFGEPEEFMGIVRPDVSEHFEITEFGRVDASDMLLRVLERPDGMSEEDAIAHPLITYPPVENDDRIIVRGDTYRAVEKQYGDVSSVSLFALTEDSRSTDSDTSDPGPEPVVPDYGAGDYGSDPYGSDDGSSDDGSSGDEDLPWT